METRRGVLKAIAGGLGMGLLALRAAAMPTDASAAVLRKKAGGSGLELPVIGLGTWQSFDVGTDAAARAPLAQVLKEFAALGGSVIDSSPMYGRSEEVAGDLIAGLGLRKRLFIATKVWTRGKAAGIEQMRASMAKLGARPIDLMQVHNLVDVDTHLETLADWKRDGAVGSIGITHYTEGVYDAVAQVLQRHRVDFLQINYSVAERAAERRLLPMARERGIAVIANRPFAGGELLRKLKGQALPGWATEVGCTSWAQLLLKFVVAHPAIVCAIPATSKVEHLRDNMSAGNGAMPGESLRERIAALTRI
ncbi:MAG TPA: aldo/keto reductase [Usitatibacteraceae bacterium]|nr:aldo/keto reductase [Usitatibacteraceae bacterium]